MIAALVAAAALGGLPQGTARYRAELGGVAVGSAEVRIECAGGACEVRAAARLRLPAEAGGGLERSEVEVAVDPFGRFRGGALRVRRGETAASPEGVAGAVPSAIVEIVLAAEAVAAAETCLPFFEEERPAPRRACARRHGDAVAADLGGVAVRIVPGDDGFPREVAVAGRFRWIRDAGAQPPARPPRLAGTRVTGPRDPRRAAAFCGVPADAPAALPPGASLPPPRADGESCREKTAAWLAEARARGIEGRTAVGVAWDGEAFVWHAWAEVRAAGAWIPVDPSFKELPARGPRFTVARFAEGDRAGREAAGVRILECWGSAGVE